MQKNIKPAAALLMLILAVVSCNRTAGNKNDGSSASSEPSKENAVRVLRDALTALQAQDYDKAATFFKIPGNAQPEEIKKQLGRLLELQEISPAGIEILARDGKWGKLDEAFSPERAKNIAERAGVPLDSCYGLSLRNAEAGFYWDGKQFKIIRCDDIGKLS